MITNNRLNKVIECVECDGSGDYTWEDDWDDRSDPCGCGSDGCDECNDYQDMDDEPNPCPECAGSGYKEDIKGSLIIFLCKHKDQTSPDENKIIRDFLLELIDYDMLTTFDVCEMIDTYHLSD